MAESNSSLGSREGQSVSEEDQRNHRGGARPRHQNFSGNRGGHQQYRNRTYHNSNSHNEGNYRQADYSERLETPDHNADNSQHYRGSRRRPFKYHHVGRHHKRPDDRASRDGDNSRPENSLQEKPVSNIHEDISILSVVEQKQNLVQNHENPRSSKGHFAPQENRMKHGGYRNRGNQAYRTHNQKDNLSLLSGVEEKQQWNSNHSNHEEYGASHRDRGNYKQFYEKEGKEYRTETNEQNSVPHSQRGRGGFRGHRDGRGDYDQFRWYGRRNFNPFGRPGIYRSQEEPIHDSMQNHSRVEGREYRTETNEPNSVSHGQRGPQPSWQHQERSARDHYERRHRSHRYQKSKTSERAISDLEDDATQRERLLQQIKEGDLECMVCCESVRHRDPVWSCLNCYHIFHFHCIRKWARSPTAVVEGSGWRCPTCQTINKLVPSQYFCYCGKVKDPERNYHDTPHSCGNVCGRKQADEDCNHPCSLLCHPGPCPPCSALVSCTCPCGAVRLQIRCGKSKTFTCDETCGKDLNCGVHKCTDKCHIGPCQPCSEIVKQECYCSKVSRDVACTETTSKTANYSCSQTCNKLLACGNHHCDHLCHDGSCFSCRLLPENVTHCPCGRVKVTDLMKGDNRKSCTEMIPTCDNTCLKILQCGPDDDLHCCQAYCHSDVCPPCPLKTNLRCRCGATSKDFFCTELKDMFQFLCEKRCNKKRRCGRHKCLITCCVDYEHLCLQVCNQKLTCGLHTCQELCHIGNCKPCLNASFEELPCRCGHSIKYPPVPCGARPPECDQICTREHPCEHPPQHKCHSEDECPPCTVLTEKWCHGGHEKRNHLPCFLSSLSCGLPCNKPLTCGQHKCQHICHEGVCEAEGSICIQPCTYKRADCEHPCGAPCHAGKPCPETSCKKLISMSCICGTRTEKVPCSENNRLFRQMSASLLASKMQDIQSGVSVDISDMLRTQKKNKTSKLDCNEECSLVERNRRLALALQIRNPDLSSKPGPPSYTEFLKDETRKNPTFVKSIHDKLTDLVQLAKQSKQKSRSHSFPPMNRDQRRVIHEMSEYFGCETESFDQEPKRNVVVTAFRDRSYLPSSSVMSAIQREMGQRKAPLPMFHVAKDSSATAKPNSTSKDPIDHFDFPQ